MKWIEVLHQFWIVCIPPKSKSKKPRSVADRGFLMVDKIGSIGCFGDLFNHHRLHPHSAGFRLWLRCIYLRTLAYRRGHSD